jgi:hypothetical protein
VGTGGSKNVEGGTLPLLLLLLVVLVLGMVVGLVGMLFLEVLSKVVQLMPPGG